MSSLSYAGLPAAWRGRELLGRPDWCSTFADTELNELATCVRATGGVALDTLAEDPALHVSLRLEPGDVLLLNNWTTFHRRSAFADASDPTAGRQLLRIWLSVPNSRPIAPCFREHFGATAGGALRGGMRRAGGSGDVDAG